MIRMPDGYADGCADMARREGACRFRSTTSRGSYTCCCRKTPVLNRVKRVVLARALSAGIDEDRYLAALQNRKKAARYREAMQPLRHRLHQRPQAAAIRPMGHPGRADPKIHASRGNWPVP
jgi:hypothetical protein